MESQTKQCPFCDESIKKEAIKCKHCGTSLNEDKKIFLNPNPANSFKLSKSEKPKEGLFLQTMNCGCMVFFLIITIIIIIIATN